MQILEKQEFKTDSWTIS